MSEKPRNQILRMVAEHLDDRNVEYKVDRAYDRLFVTEKLLIGDKHSDLSAVIRQNGRGVSLYVSRTPVEGAVMAICGPEKRLEDKYPTAKRHMSFANVSMSLETDYTDVLLPVEKVEMLKEHMDRLKHKVKNQKTDLRRMHLKCMRQQDEIARMEENSLRMAVLYMGYSEGE